MTLKKYYEIRLEVLNRPPSLVVTHLVELDRYIGNTHHRGRLWDNRNHWQMMTIGDQSVPMFQDDVTQVLNSPSHGLRRPPVQNYSRFCPASVFDGCSSAEGGL